MKLGAMNHPQRDIFDEIRRITMMGFDYLDLTIEAPRAAPENTDWVAVRDALGEAGLGVVCHAAPYLPIDNPSPLVRQAALDELRRCVDVAQIVQATLCTTHFLGWPSYLPEKAGYEYYRQLYDVLLRHGRERGVDVAMENDVDNQHQLKYFREIFHRLPKLKLLYDIGHGNIGTAQSMTRAYLFALADRLAHVHISDNDGTGDNHLPFGAPITGGISLQRELQELRNFSYDGTITVEVFGDQQWAIASAEMIRELWPSVG